MTQRNDRRGNARPQDGYVPASNQQGHGCNAHHASSHNALTHAASTRRPSVKTSRDAYGQNARSARYQSQGARRNAPNPQMRYAGNHVTGASQYSRYAPSMAYQKPRMSGGKKALIVILIVALIAGLGFFVYKEWQKSVFNNDLRSGLSQDELMAIDMELTGMTRFDEPFTMLLLGSDARSGDPSMGARTDTIILVRIDPITNNITMLSIPRDTRIYIDGYGYEKFNAAYSYGGARGTIAAVKKLCGIDIDHYAEINFEGLVDLVDAIGGIDVEVDETIDDPDAGNVVIPAGKQHLDGEAALVFSRSRAYADGDYTRVSNQRKVIEAIIKRGLETPASELSGLINASAKFLTTDSAMDFEFIYSLADQIRHNEESVTITTATIPSEAQTIGGISYVLADEDGVAEIIKIFLKGGDVAAFVEKYTPNVASAYSDTSGSGSAAGSNYNNDYTYSGNGGSAGYGTYDPSYDPGYSTDPGTGSNPGNSSGTSGGTDPGVSDGETVTTPNPVD